MRANTVITRSCCRSGARSRPRAFHTRIKCVHRTRNTRRIRIQNEASLCEKRWPYRYRTPGGTRLNHAALRFPLGGDTLPIVEVAPRRRRTDAIGHGRANAREKAVIPTPRLSQWNGFRYTRRPRRAPRRPARTAHLLSVRPAAAGHRLSRTRRTYTSHSAARALFGGTHDADSPEPRTRPTREAALAIEGWTDLTPRARAVAGCRRGYLACSTEGEGRHATGISAAWPAGSARRVMQGACRAAAAPHWLLVDDRIRREFHTGRGGVAMPCWAAAPRLHGGCRTHSARIVPGRRLGRRPASQGLMAAPRPAPCREPDRGG